MLKLDNKVCLNLGLHEIPEKEMPSNTQNPVRTFVDAQDFPLLQTRSLVYKKNKDLCFKMEKKAKRPSFLSLLCVAMKNWNLKEITPNFLRGLDSFWRGTKDASFRGCPTQ